jgi:succinoglycan biosynthesis transport protein ExoP
VFEMMIKHYLELLSHYRKLVIIIVVALTSAAAVVSAIILFTAPLNTATASVVMLPTEAELTFTRGWLGFSQYNPANVLTQTQMEYLLSRPVAEKTLHKVIEDIAAKPRPTGFKAFVGSAVSKSRSLLRRTYTILNSGKFVPLDPQEEALQELMDGIKIEMIEGSYVLQIKVTLLHPAAAAAAANALAGAYDEMIAEQSIQAASRLGSFFDKEIAAREAELDTLAMKEYELRKELDVLSLEDQRQYLLNALENERQALAAAQVELAEFDARMAALRSEQGDVQQRRILAKLDEEMTMEGVTRTELVQRVALRKKNIASLKGEQEQLAQKEEPLNEIETRKDAVGADLASLRERMLNVQMSTSSQLAQVRMINPARVPLYPSFPKVVLNTAIGFVAAILLSFFVLVLMDTTSGTVKTFTDLRRLVGARAVARLSPAMLANAGRGGAGRTAREMADLARDLTVHLAGRNGDRPLRIEVTGFDDRDVAEAASTVAAALARRGERVICRLPASVPTPKPAEDGGVGGRLRFVSGAGEAQESGEEGAISIECLTGGSPWARMASPARGEAALLCAIASGAVPEEDLQALDESARAAGASDVLYVLVAR